MTRINVGVPPSELCDQHLIAEYHELPRLWKFTPKSKPPEHFCLGKGHILWCAQYPGMLAARYGSIVSEMRSRGFSVRYPDPPDWAFGGRFPPVEETLMASILVRRRLAQRVATMKNPRWTKRPTSATATTAPESSAPAA